MDEKIRVEVEGLIPFVEITEKVKEFPGLDEMSADDVLDIMMELKEVFMMGVEVGVKVTQQRHADGDDNG